MSFQLGLDFMDVLFGGCLRIQCLADGNRFGLGRRLSVSRRTPVCRKWFCCS